MALFLLFHFGFCGSDYSAVVTWALSWIRVPGSMCVSHPWAESLTTFLLSFASEALESRRGREQTEAGLYPDLVSPALPHPVQKGVGWSVCVGWLGTPGRRSLGSTSICSGREGRLHLRAHSGFLSSEVECSRKFSVPSSLFLPYAAQAGSRCRASTRAHTVPSDLWAPQASSLPQRKLQPARSHGAGPFSSSAGVACQGLVSAASRAGGGGLWHKQLPELQTSGVM